MSGNRFADCDTVAQVLRSVLPIGPNSELWDALEAEALARIRELTRPTVDEAPRERARKAAAIYAGREDLVDRIIDALGYTTPADDALTINNHHPGASPTPAVELDADIIERTADAIRCAGGFIGPYDRLVFQRDAEELVLYRNEFDRLVLRIGGGK